MAFELFSNNAKLDPYRVQIAAPPEPAPYSKKLEVTKVEYNDSYLGAVNPPGQAEDYCCPMCPIPPCDEEEYKAWVCAASKGLKFIKNPFAMVMGKFIKESLTQPSPEGEKTRWHVSSPTLWVAFQLVEPTALQAIPYTFETKWWRPNGDNFPQFSSVTVNANPALINPGTEVPVRNARFLIDRGIPTNQVGPRPCPQCVPPAPDPTPVFDPDGVYTYYRLRRIATSPLDIGTPGDASYLDSILAEYSEGEEVVQYPEGSPNPEVTCTSQELADRFGMGGDWRLLDITGESNYDRMGFCNGQISRYQKYAEDPSNPPVMFGLKFHELFDLEYQNNGLPDRPQNNETWLIEVTLVYKQPRTIYYYNDCEFFTTYQDSYQYYGDKYVKMINFGEQRLCSQRAVGTCYGERFAIPFVYKESSNDDYDCTGFDADVVGQEAYDFYMAEAARFRELENSTGGAESIAWGIAADAAENQANNAYTQAQNYSDALCGSDGNYFADANGDNWVYAQIYRQRNVSGITFYLQENFYSRAVQNPFDVELSGFGHPICQDAYVNIYIDYDMALYKLHGYKNWDRHLELIDARIVSEDCVANIHTSPHLAQISRQSRFKLEFTNPKYIIPDYEYSYNSRLQYSSCEPGTCGFPCGWYQEEGWILGNLGPLVCPTTRKEEESPYYLLPTLTAKQQATYELGFYQIPIEHGKAAHVPFLYRDGDFPGASVLTCEGIGIFTPKEAYDCIINTIPDINLPGETGKPYYRYWDDSIAPSEYFDTGAKYPLPLLDSFWSMPFECWESRNSPGFNEASCFQGWCEDPFKYYTEQNKPHTYGVYTNVGCSQYGGREISFCQRNEIPPPVPLPKESSSSSATSSQTSLTESSGSSVSDVTNSAQSNNFSSNSTSSSSSESSFSSISSVTASSVSSESDWRETAPKYGSINITNKLLLNIIPYIDITNINTYRWYDFFIPLPAGTGRPVPSGSFINRWFARQGGITEYWKLGANGKAAPYDIYYPSDMEAGVINAAWSDLSRRARITAMIMGYAPNTNFF